MSPVVQQTQFFLLNPLALNAPYTLPTATQASPYSAQIPYSGGIPPYTFVIISGTLASGLSLNASTGIISGTTESYGEIDSLTVKLTDAAGDAQAVQTYLLQVVPAVSVSTTMPGATQFLPYNGGFNASGGTPPYTWVENSRTSANAWTDSGGIVSGTPTVADTDLFNMTATDSNGFTGSGIVNLVVTANPLVIVTASPLPAAVDGTAYSVTLQASGGSGVGQAWALTGGALPGGLSLSAAGVISGTPSTSGNFSLTVQITDSLTSSAPVVLTMSVAAEPVASTPVFNPASGTYLSAQSVAISSATSGAIIWYTTDGTTPSPGTQNALLQLPTYTDLYGHTYVSGAAGTLNGQTGSSPNNMPAGAVWMLSENQNPAQSNGFFLPNTWNAGAYTGFTPINPNNQSQLSVAATGPSSTMQWENGTMGAIMFGSDLSTSANRPQFTPQINFTNTPGSGPVLFTDTTVALSNTMTMQCPTWVNAGGETNATAPYIHVNLGQVIPGATAELVINIGILDGSSEPNDIWYAYVGQTLPAYNFHIPFNAASAASLNLCTFTSGSWFNGTFGQTIFSWSISYAQMQNILNLMAAHSWGANPAFPSLNPTQLTLNQTHVNAEMPNLSTISLGWSMSAWNMNSVSSGAGASPIYSSPITVSATETVQAIATASGYAQSAVGSAAYVINPVVITTTALPTATFNVSYSFTMAAAGGLAPYTWSITAGTLPPGIAFSTAGVFSGTPTALGSGPLTIQAIDSNGLPASGNFTITVQAAAPTFIPPSGSAVVANSTVQVNSTAGGTIYYTTDGTAPVHP